MLYTIHMSTNIDSNPKPWLAFRRTWAALAFLCQWVPWTVDIATQGSHGDLCYIREFAPLSHRK